MRATPARDEKNWRLLHYKSLSWGSFVPVLSGMTPGGRTRGRSFKANQKSDSVTVLKEPERNCPAAFVPKTNASGVGKNAVASPMSSGAALAKR